MNQYKIDFRKDEDVLRYAKECVNIWSDFIQDVADDACVMRKFLYKDGGQWDSESAEDRTNRGKTCLSVNVIRPVIRKIISEQLANDAQVVTVPANAKIPTKVIKAKTGLFRDICYKSNTSMVYATCYRNMIDTSFGAYYVTTDDESPYSFNQVLRYEPINDSLMSIFDPYAKTMHKTDGNFSGFYSAIGCREYYERYGEDDIDPSTQSYPVQNGEIFDGFNKGNVIVLNFYAREYKRINIVRLDDGSEMSETVFNDIKEQLTAKNEEAKEIWLAAGNDESEFDEPYHIPAVAKRKRSIECKIWYFLLCKDKVLERIPLPLKERLPVVYIPAEEAIIDGKKLPVLFANDAKAPQQLANYCASEMLDSINRSIGARVIAHNESVEEYLDEWARPRETNLMRYVTPESNPNAEPPKLVVAPSIDQGVLALYQQSMNDIKSVMGRFNENMGDQSNAVSGVAILNRQMSGDMSVGVLPHNLNSGIAEGAKIIFEWMPYVYDTERDVIVRGKDNKAEYMTINQVMGVDEFGNDIMQTQIGTPGEFTIEVSGGMSFAAQRLAGMQFLADMAGDDQNLKSISYDLLVEESPFSWANELVRRMRESGYINQEVLADENGEQVKKKEPSMMEKMAKAQMIMQFKELLYKEEEMKMKKLEGKLKIIKEMVDIKGRVDSKKADILIQSQKNLADNVASLAELEKTAAETGSDSAAEAASAIENIINEEFDRLSKDLG